MAKRVAVLLCGCGHRDGSEIHETACVLLALDRAGAEYVGVAPDQDQTQVVNHIDQSASGGTRNMLQEAARIMRGNVKALAGISADNFDALIIPGGFGAAMNFCNYASAGSNCEVDNSVKKLILDFLNSGRPVGAICISPVVVAKSLEGSGVKPVLTIGNDTKVAADLEKMGAVHRSCAADDIVTDSENKIVTTPAYMLATRITQVNTGISKLVDKILKMS